jgi:hypothetical protein
MKKFSALLLFACLLVSMNAQMGTAQVRPGKPKAVQNAKLSPWVGTWKMDTAQSKLHGPVPKEETLTIETAGVDHIKYSIHSVGQDSEYTLAYDGKPDTSSAVLMNGQPAGTATYHRVTSQKYTGKAAMGKSLTTDETISLSPDKKKVTVRIQAKSDKEQYEEIAVYTK